MSSVVSQVRGSLRAARVRRGHNKFSQLAYLILTNGGKDGWLRFDRDVRVLRIFAQVVIFAIALTVREMLGRKALDR